MDLSLDGTNASVSDSLSGTATTVNVSYLTKGSGGSAVTATAAITVGAGTTYANTAQGLINAINNAGLGLNATFTTAAQAGSAAVSTAQAANATTAGLGSDTGIEISGTGLGTGTNGTGVVGALNVAASSNVLSGTMTIVGSDGKSHAITLGTANSTDTLANLAATINTDAYGITASLSNGGDTLTLTSDDSAVTVSATAITQTTSPTPTALPNLASMAGTLTVGASTDTLGGTLIVTDTTGGTHTVTLGIPGTTDTLADLKTYLNVTNAAWGITATITGGTAMTFAGTGSDNITGTGLTETAAPATTATALVDTPTVDTQYYSQVGTFTVAASGDALSGTLQIGQNTITLGAAGATATIGELATYINNGSFGVKATLNPAGTAITFTSANSAMTFAGAPVDVATPDPVVTTGNASFSEYYSVGITGSITDSSTGGGTVTTGLTVDTNGTGGTATISYSDGAGVDLASTDLTTQGDSELALQDINDAISAAAALDGYVGGQINTLNAISQVMSTQQENVVSAQNAVQATDYASATSNMSKYEILSQTGIAALAQANSVQQEVTKLLQ
jgi:flagellin